MTVDNCGNNNKKATKNKIFIFNLHFCILAQAAHHEEDDNRDTERQKRNKWQL